MFHRISALLIIFTLLPISVAIAQDTTAQAFGNKEYSPEYCAFSANFPEEPYITKKCETEDESSCFNLISYTKVFEGLSSAVNVEIICNPSNKEFYDNFTEKVMEDTVKAMTKDTIIESYEIQTSQSDKYRQTGILGRGRRGLHDTIYIAQIWLTENSIMSIEADMSGEQNDQADQVFADILRSIGYKEKGLKPQQENEFSQP